jgi:hypothetical protein
LECPEKTGILNIGVVNGIVVPISPSPTVDPDLLDIARKWAFLPAAIRAGISAMVNTIAPDLPAGPMDTVAESEGHHYAGVTANEPGGNIASKVAKIPCQLASSLGNLR